MLFNSEWVKIIFLIDNLKKENILAILNNL